MTERQRIAARLDLALNRVARERRAFAMVSEVQNMLREAAERAWSAGWQDGMGFSAADPDPDIKPTIFPADFELVEVDERAVAARETMRSFGVVNGTVRR